jgi:phage FluMu protein Com
MKCPVCDSVNLINCPSELLLTLPNMIVYDYKNDLWKQIIEFKMCSNCKYIMYFYVGDVSK